MSDFEQKVTVILQDLKQLLLDKNEKYGNSALEPVRVFSKASPVEQILVRLDDKLSRLRTQHVSEDEDVTTDLMGYLVLLQIAKDAEINGTIGNVKTSSKDVHRAVNSEATEGMKNLRLMQMYNAVERWLEDSTLSLADRNEVGVILLDDSRASGDCSDNFIRFENYDDFFEWLVTEHPDQYISQGGNKEYAKSMRQQDDS